MIVFVTIATSRDILPATALRPLRNVVDSAVAVVVAVSAEAVDVEAVPVATAVSVVCGTAMHSTL